MIAADAGGAVVGGQRGALGGERGGGGGAEEVIAQDQIAVAERLHLGVGEREAHTRMVPRR